MISLRKESEKYYQLAITNLQNFIKINSIYDETTISENKPFGEGVSKALTFIADLAEQDGFNIDRCDGYCTEISFGQGPLIAIYAHADVVPVSGEWKFPPFSATIENDIMYGRGTSDDKGPLIASYYAFKMLRDLNLIKNFKVTLVVGGNEERGSKCLDYYFHHLNKPYPEYGFTPDGDFPLIYGEKAIAGYEVVLEKNFDNLLSLEGGVVLNSVIDKAVANLKVLPSNEVISSYCQKNHLRYQIDKQTLTFFGKSSHGSIPQEGINAGLHLIRFIGERFGYDELVKTANNYLDGLGKEMKMDHEAPLLHESTYNVGLISYRDGVLKYQVNYRYGEDVDLDEVIAKLNAMNLGTVSVFSRQQYLLVDPKSKFIKTLLTCYQEETGDKKNLPMAIGGGTYAKESKNTVAFGSHFPGREDHIHDCNEKIHIEDLTSSISIYAKAIYHLGLLATGGKDETKA